MKKPFNTEGLPNTEGETNSNEILRSIKALIADPLDSVGCAAISGALRQLIRQQARNIKWPSNDMMEDVTQTVLEELMPEGISNDDPLKRHIVRNANEETIIQRLKKIVSLRLQSRYQDKIRTKKWKNTVLGRDYDTDPAEESEKSNIPEMEEVLRTLRNLDKMRSVLPKDREIVAEILQTGKKNLSQAAAEAGISKATARRAIIRIRPHLRRDFEMD